MASITSERDCLFTCHSDSLQNKTEKTSTTAAETPASRRKEEIHGTEQRHTTALTPYCPASREDAEHWEYQSEDAALLRRIAKGTHRPLCADTGSGAARLVEAM